MPAIIFQRELNLIVEEVGHLGVLWRKLESPRNPRSNGANGGIRFSVGVPVFVEEQLVVAVGALHGCGFFLVRFARGGVYLE